MENLKEWFNDDRSQASRETDLTRAEISDGLKDMLQVGVTTVIGQLGTYDGFNMDPAVHIPLPEKLRRVQNVLDRAGLAFLMDDLETELNRAAEQAAPEAKRLFWQAIGDMTVTDAMSIYKGPSDAATRYFQERMTPEIARAFKPKVEASLSRVGAVATYERILGEYRSIPFVPDVQADLAEYVVGKGIDGIFLYLGREEAAIRADPAKRTTDLVRKLFAE